MNLIATNKIEVNRYELEISVGQEEFKPAVDRAFKKNIAKMNVPGFRRGKAPRAMIEKMYGKGVFFEDAVNEIYPAAYSKAIEESKLEPVDRADIEVTEMNEDGFSFKATVTVKPEVTIKDYKGLEVTRGIYTAKDEEIDAEIEKLRDRNSRMVTVEDRTAENGDITVIDFEGFMDGIAFDGGKGENFSLTLGSGQFIPGFEDQMIGKSVGEEFDIDVTFPEEYQAEELKGKAVVFKVKLHEIKAKELPLVDNEFAKDVSEFDTVEELRTDLKSKLQTSGEKRAVDEMENELSKKLSDNMEADIPGVMIERRIDETVQDFSYRLQSQGMELDVYLQYTGMDMESFRNTFAQNAEQSVRLRLALEKVAEIEGITVSEDELIEEYDRLVKLYNVEVERLKTFAPEKDVKKDLAVNKAIDLIRDNAKITEVVL